MILRKMSGQVFTYMGLNKLMDTIAAYFYASQFPIFSRLDQSLFLGLALRDIITLWKNYRSIVTSYLNVSKEKNFFPQETNVQLADLIHDLQCAWRQQGFQGLKAVTI